MPLLAGISTFFDRYVLGYALGTAAGPSLEPFVQDLANVAWEANQVYPVEPGDAAEIVAEDVEQHEWGAHEAAQHGISGERFDALVGAVLNAPGLAELFDLWRRNEIGDADFTHGLRKARLETRWDGPLKALKDRLLAADILANARQQGFVTVDRQHAESALQGVDQERADILYELSGLPPGVDVAQFAANRNLIGEAEFAQIVREGHTKTKYTDLLWAMRQPVLSAATYRTLHLKGWISVAEMNAGGALHGYTPEQMNLMYLEAGRPAAPAQMATAAARGIDGPEGRPMDRAQFLKGIQESDIRPEWAPMLWDARFLYPPLFQLSRLVTAGAISADLAAEWAKKDRYPPEVVDALHAYWSQGTATKADTHLGKAQTQLWTTLHRSYLSGESSEAEVGAALPRAGVAAGSVPDVLATWDEERTIIRKQLSPAQVKKAYAEAVLNPETGAAWTKDEATAALVARGYSTADATTFLEL